MRQKSRRFLSGALALVMMLTLMLGNVAPALAENDTWVYINAFTPLDAAIASQSYWVGDESRPLSLDALGLPDTLAIAGVNTPGDGTEVYTGSGVPVTWACTDAMTGAGATYAGEIGEYVFTAVWDESEYELGKDAIRPTIAVEVTEFLGIAPLLQSDGLDINIDLDEGLDFGSVEEGYDAEELKRTVTFTNNSTTGTTFNVAMGSYVGAPLPSGEYLFFDFFLLSDDFDEYLAPGESFSFTLKPSPDLPVDADGYSGLPFIYVYPSDAGYYSFTFPLSFNVTAAVAPIPSAPRNLAVTPASKNVYLEWDKPADNASAIAGYEVYHQIGTEAPVLYQTFAANTVSTFVSRLTNGQEYTFIVKAVNADGEGDQATIVGMPFTIPKVTVTTAGLDTLKAGQAVTNASILFTAEEGIFPAQLAAADYAITGLPAGLTAGAPVRTSDTIVTVPITGTPTTSNANSAPLTYATSIPVLDYPGDVNNIAPRGTITAGPVAEDDSDTTIPVTDITGVPTGATVYFGRRLSGTVLPADATNKDIVWSVKDAGTTGVQMDGDILSTSGTGTAILTATIKDGLGVGSDYAKDFTLDIGNVVLTPASWDGVDLGTAPVGYEPDDYALNLTAENLFAEAVTLSGSFAKDLFTISVNGGADSDSFNMTIGAGQTATITVKPKAGLTVDTYSDLIAGAIGPMILTGDVQFDYAVSFKVYDDFVPVTNITGVTKTLTVGAPRFLSGTVAPANATYSAITWSIKDAGGTGATLSAGTLSATKGGTVVVTATVAKGKSETENYTQDFSIIVNEEFVPVEEITGIPLTVEPGEDLVLSGTVEPANASNQVIVWTIVDDGGTNAVISPSNVLSYTRSGTVVLLATVVNGETGSTDYTQQFSIMVRAAEVPATTYTIDVSAKPAKGGTVSGGGDYEEDESCTVTAKANSDYEFVSWTEDGDVVSENANYTFTVDSDRELVANFESIEPEDEDDKDEDDDVPQTGDNGPSPYVWLFAIIPALLIACVAIWQIIRQRRIMGGR